ncbi:ABC transporter ATP-binding protein [Natrinema sp. 1APR25-10V2]|uniref:ABC transporter ATP-binding protein n=1 Tax=Natrinema sp. 1APR25-10V2 TaxID=2951081 RepID=UPI00287606E1|nr:ABC transporter ATP-binding protein [Natrinema sp. 1APR25-10V2]MDS0474624.1 ABC transporter ATP-binding protein [Natrinema sp. 1APR25-10V2]
MGTTTPPSETDTANETLVRGDSLEKTYGSRLPFGRSTPVLTGADIEVRAGEIVGIVGENGSGKSTLMKILVGVLNQDRGTVERTGTVGWCPQEPLLYERLTVSETFRLFGAGYGMSREEIDAAKQRLADDLDFEQYLDYRVDQLSGGNRQKVNLSVALMHDPDVLMLDEPYTGFDWETYLRFWDMAQDLADDGIAVVMISHLIEEQSRLDRIYEVRDGLVYDVTDEKTESELRSDQEGGTDA